MIGGGLNASIAGARNSPAVLYSALKVRDEPLWRERSLSHAACPVCAGALPLNVAIAATITNRVDLT
jgi:hypothetical protein